MSEQQALVEDQAVTVTGGSAMFERLASDPNVSVEKLSQLMDLWERMEGKKAEAEFSRDFIAAQQQMKSIRTDSYNSQTRSRYASYEAIDRAIRPIYTAHGFAQTFTSADSPLGEHVRVVCKLRHRAGHTETYHVDIPVDGKGAKGGDVMTKTHAMGSGLSYGKRYLVGLIWDLSTTEKDDDGNTAGGRETPKPPAGFDEWWTDLGAAADNGIDVLQAAWKKSRADFRSYVTSHRGPEMDKLKDKARKVGAK